MMQPQTQQQLLEQLDRHNGTCAQGPQKLMDMEEEAADLAIATGLYVTWQSTKHNRKDDCTRVGPRSKCFCGHSYAGHMKSRDRRKPCQHTKCRCKGYAFIPQRPEECGDWWLTRRKGFNVNNWRCKCNCGCAHDRHHPHLKHCLDCGCGTFNSNFLCIACDGHWEEHETVYESEQERRQNGTSFGPAFRPLANTPNIRSHVFDATQKTGRPRRDAPTKTLEQQWESGEITAQEYQQLVASEGTVTVVGESKFNTSARSRVRVVERTRKTQGRPERSVRLSGKASGGTATGRVANRWGKMEK